MTLQHARGMLQTANIVVVFSKLKTGLVVQTKFTWLHAYFRAATSANVNIILNVPLYLQSIITDLPSMSESLKANWRLFYVCCELTPTSYVVKTSNATSLQVTLYERILITNCRKCGGFPYQVCRQAGSPKSRCCTWADACSRARSFCCKRTVGWHRAWSCSVQWRWRPSHFQSGARCTRLKLNKREIQGEIFCNSVKICIW